MGIRQLSILAVVAVAVALVAALALNRESKDAAAAPAPSALASLPAPSGPTVLEVTGGISVTNGDGSARFDLALLESLPQTSFTTSTLWTSGPQEFSGVSLRDFLDALGATGSRLEMRAVNDYVIEVPVSDAVVGGPILAVRIDGTHMSVRDKGPIWLIYPYDENPEYQSEVIYSRSIWQLARIEVLP